jgi:hypothetical protein
MVKMVSFSQKLKFWESLRVKKGAGSLLRFAHKTSKNRRLGDFVPYKLPSNQRFAHAG